jgi:hypothetical protein
MADFEQGPFSDDQLQSTQAGPPDAAPWALTLAVIVILVVLLVGGFFLWRRSSETELPGGARAVSGPVSTVVSPDGLLNGPRAA